MRPERLTTIQQLNGNGANQHRDLNRMFAVQKHENLKCSAELEYVKIKDILGCQTHPPHPFSP